MQQPQIIFSQVMEWIPHYVFQRIVARHRADYRIQSFSCWDQFLCMAFAQLTYRESLRDIESDRGFKVVIDRNKRKILISFDAKSVDSRHKIWLEALKNLRVLKTSDNKEFHVKQRA